MTGMGPGGVPMGGYTTPSGSNWAWPMAGAYVEPGGFLDSLAPGLTLYGGTNPSRVFG